MYAVPRLSLNLGNQVEGAVPSRTSLDESALTCSQRVRLRLNNKVIFIWSTPSAPMPRSGSCNAVIASVLDSIIGQTW